VVALTVTRGEEGATHPVGPTAVCGLGIDAVDVERFRRVIARRPTLIERVFTDAERADVSRMSDPVPSLAARFAAKESVMKALGVGIGALGLREVEVTRAEGGAPGLELDGRAADLAAKQGVGTWRVSLTHTEALSIAVVVALGAQVLGAQTGGAAS
jgi:holo-[acyl-carrier protein] synthase